MIDPNAIALPEWLRQFGMLVGGDLPMDDARERLRAYGEALRSDFAASVFTADSARHVARHANPKGFFPRYAEVCAALVEWAKDNPPRTMAIAGPVAAATGHWARFVSKRLAEGADPAHLLSLIRTHADPAEVRAIMAQHFRRELQAEDRHAAEARDDKARAAAAVVSATVIAAAPPRGPKGAGHAAKPIAEPVAPRERLLTGDALAEARAKAGIRPLLVAAE